jgi:hypothetical protein
MKDYYGGGAVIFNLYSWLEARQDELNARGTIQVGGDAERDLDQAIMRVEHTYHKLRPETRKIADMIDRQLSKIVNKE